MSVQFSRPLLSIYVDMILDQVKKCGEKS